MGIFYVDSVSGDDTNDGTSAGQAWQTLDYAMAMLSAGDALTMIAPAATPFRNGLEPPAGTQCQGQSQAIPAYLLGTVNVSHGATVENPVKNGGCEAWLSASSPWAITQAAGDTIARSVDAHGGAYSIDATKAAASIWLGLYVYLPASTAMQFAYWHKGSVAGRWRFEIYDISANEYLQADGSWAAAAYLFDPNDFNAAWHSYTKPFTTNSAGRYQVILTQQFAEAVYLDDISLVYTGATTYQWGDVVGKNYKLLNLPIPLQPYLLATCATEEWTGAGALALDMAPLVADLATLDLTPGGWYYDAASDAVYYHPASGEDVTDLHIELGQPRIQDNADSVAGVVYLSGADATVQDVSVYCANRYGALTSTAIPRLRLNRVNVNHAALCCYAILGGSVLRADTCSGRYTYEEDIFVATGAGAMLIADRCLAEYAADDGFQAVGGSTIRLTRCVALYNGTEEAGDNSGISSEGDGTILEVYNCTVYGNYGLGIAHSGTGAGSCVIQNCIVWETQTGAANDVQMSVVHSPITHDHNLFGGHSGAWVVDGTEIEGSDPQFESVPAGNWRLKIGSPAIGAGTDVGLFYSGDAPDCGAYERWASRGATSLHLAGAEEEV